MNDMSAWQEQLTQDIWLVGIRGRLDQSLSPQLEERLVDLLEQGNCKLVVDLSGVTYINSGGLRCLVSAWRKAQGQNGDVILFGLNTRLQEIFAMIGFDSVFKIHDSSDLAQAAFEDSSK